MVFDRIRDALVPGTKVPLDMIPQGGGVVLPDAPYLVTHPASGEYCAFRKQCPHAGRHVDEVAGAEIRCAAHGSTFDARTGQALSGPATRGLAPARVRIDGDRLIITN